MFLNSKINLLSGLATVLVLGFSSCTEVPIDTDQIVHRKVTDEYKSNFIAKYGQPAPDQSWDFSGRFSNGNIEEVPYESTRAISSATVVNYEYELDCMTVQVLRPNITTSEIEYIKQHIGSEEVKDWTPNIYGIHDLWVYCIHDNGVDPNGTTFSLGVHYISLTGGSYNHGTEYFTGLPIMGTSYSGDIGWGPGWYPGDGYGSRGMGFRIDFSILNDYEEVYWYSTSDNDEIPLTDPYANPTEFKIENEMKTYKEIETPYGAIYWCFDCDHDGDYSDLVCLVEPAQGKRYIIEDLGALDDFDFNDIVVDVMYSNRVLEDGQVVVAAKQKAFVRALGGTLDFTLTIGNTTWSKSENDFDPVTVYNAYEGSIDYNATLAEFDVSGWIPSENNISVTVKQKESGDAIISFPFPKAGEVPMIIAINPTTYFSDPVNPSARMYWMPERVSIPARLFTE